MKIISLPRILLGLAAVLFLGSGSSAEILKIVVDDTIQPITQEYISRAIDEAERRNDQAVLLEINTPGGLVDSTRRIIEKITSSRVPVIVYVGPSGSRAGSAGIFLLEAADVAAMAPGTNAGAAHPVLIGPFAPKVNDEMKRKIENDTAAVMRAVASKRGRKVEVAESAVLESKSFTEQEALSQHLIDYVASSENDLFRQMENRTFKRFTGQEVTLKLSGQTIAPFGMTLHQRILGYLMDPNISFILLAIGGISLLTRGGLLLIDSPIPELRVHLMTALAVSVPMGLITAFLMTLALKARRNKVVTGVEGLVGQTGVAQTTVSPRGQIFVHGELWDAVSSSDVSAGQAVVVRRIDGLVLQVDPLIVIRPAQATI